MTSPAYNALSLTKQEAAFILDCIRFADYFHPRVDPRLFETIAPNLIQDLQEIAGGE
jgi:hypothetical protein